MTNNGNAQSDGGGIKNCPKNKSVIGRCYCRYLRSLFWSKEVLLLVVCKVNSVAEWWGCCTTARANLEVIAPKQPSAFYAFPNNNLTFFYTQLFDCVSIANMLKWILRYKEEVASVSSIKCVFHVRLKSVKEEFTFSLVDKIIMQISSLSFLCRSKLLLPTEPRTVCAIRWAPARRLCRLRAIPAAGVLSAADDICQQQPE